MPLSREEQLARKRAAAARARAEHPERHRLANRKHREKLGPDACREAWRRYARAVREKKLRAQPLKDGESGIVV